MDKTRSVALIIAFAAVTAALDMLPGLPQLSSGVWYGWTFIAIPLAGIVLGPWEAFLSVFTGVMISHAVVFFGPYEYLFTVGAPIGAMVCSLTFRRRPLPVLPIYIGFLVAYFLTPVAWKLPLWAMWDTYVAFIVLLLLVALRDRMFGLGNGQAAFAFTALVGLEADILFRIFLFIPLGTWDWLLHLPLEFVQTVWGLNALVTPVQVGIALFTTSVAGRILVGATGVSATNPEHRRT